MERFNPAGSVALVGFESVGIPSTTATDSFSELSPKFVLDYQVTDNTLIYAGITMGFKSGGFNNFPFDTATAQVAFDPETITSYETGLKSTLLEGRMQLNVSAFFYDYNNLQVRTVVSSGGIEVPQIRNAAKAEVYGGEMALTARVTPELQLEVTYGFLDTKYKDFADFSGNRLTRAPKHSFSAALDYAREVPTLDGTFIFRADYNYTSKIYFSPKQIDILSQDGFGLVNLRMAFEHESGWSIAAYGKNLANKTYNGHVIDLLDFDLAFAQIGAPRQYGLSLSYHF
ncbi:MAG: TonB-dependent receptor [Kordiimonadaceae bacterium]|nr:TonB-dependent receptor [Kordiimonadaceae bacterium]